LYLILGAGHHGANGYLLEQFLKDGTNQHDDVFGGSVENRVRLMLEVTAAVKDEIGAERMAYAFRLFHLLMRFHAVIRSHSMTDAHALARDKIFGLIGSLPASSSIK